MSTKQVVGKKAGGRVRTMSEQVHVWMTPDERRMAEELAASWGLPLSITFRQMLRMVYKSEGLHR